MYKNSRLINIYFFSRILEQCFMDSFEESISRISVISASMYYEFFLNRQCRYNFAIFFFNAATLCVDFRRARTILFTNTFGLVESPPMCPLL